MYCLGWPLDALTTDSGWHLFAFYGGGTSGLFVRRMSREVGSPKSGAKVRKNFDICKFQGAKKWYFWLFLWEKNKLIAKRERRIQSACNTKKDRPNRIRTQWTKYNRQKSKDNRQKTIDREVWHSFCYFITDRPTDCKTAKAVRPSQSDCRTALL